MGNLLTRPQMTDVDPQLAGESPVNAFDFFLQSRGPVIGLGHRTHAENEKGQQCRTGLREDRLQIHGAPCLRRVTNFEGSNAACTVRGLSTNRQLRSGSLQAIFIYYRYT